MRAICEVCSHPQPPDWQAGDLCTACGQAVRRVVRCFWCAKWTPAGKFCRRCGAAVLEESLYGAARMLREAGTDRFRIPKLIMELERDQVDNFTRIYQRHAAILYRHVDQVRFLESFLHQRHWSGELEDQLIPELPWPDERLERLSAAAGPELHGRGGRTDRAEDLATARAIEQATPFPVTRTLAPIVRLLLDDWAAQREVASMLRLGDASIRSEAALALSGWRVQRGPGISYGYDDLISALRDCPLRTPAALRLALLRVPGYEVPPEITTSADPEVQFMAALAQGNCDVLAASLRDPDELVRFTAAFRLIELWTFAPLRDMISTVTPESQVRLFQAIAKTGQPAPALREPIFQIAEATASQEVRRAAVRVLCCGCSMEEVERLARAASGDSSSYQSILQRAALPPEGLERFGAWLLEHDAFRADQFGMKDIARADRMPADFVPRHWPTANDAARTQLCGFAEFQLSEYGDEGLHRFLVGVAFGPGPVEVRSTVFNTLYRWYYWQDTSRKSTPIAIRKDSIERLFGSVPAFLSIYTRFLKDPNLRELLGAAILADPLTGMLRNADPDVLPGFVEQPRAVSALADAVAEIADDKGFGVGPRNECIAFLAWLGQAPEFHKKMRARVVAFKGTDLDYACSRALERLHATSAAV